METFGSSCILRASRLPIFMSYVMHGVRSRHLSGKGMCQLMPRVLLDGHAFLIFSREVRVRLNSRQHFL